MIAPHGTGCALAASGHLLPVDVISGRLAARESALDLVIARQVLGTTEFDHQEIARRLSPEAP